MDFQRATTEGKCNFTKGYLLISVEVFYSIFFIWYMLHFSTNNGIYIVSFLPLQWFLYMHVHNLDTDESKEKLALFDLHHSFIPAFTMFSFFASTKYRYRWFWCKACLDWREVTSDNLYRYFYLAFSSMYNIHTCTCSPWLKYKECKEK